MANGGKLMKKYIFRPIKRLVRGSLRLIKAIVWTPFRFVLWAILKTARLAVSIRNKILKVVDKLESESQKWQRVFTVARFPYRILLVLGLSPAQATALLSASAVVTSGVAVQELVLEEISFENGSPGIYEAPTNLPVFYDGEEFQTLRVDLGATPVGLLELNSISVNTYANSALPTGQTNALILGGLPASNDPAFVETYLEVGDLYIEKWRCSKLIMEHIEVNHLIFTKNAADGISHNMVAGTPRARGISGGVRAEKMQVSNSTYDQIVITAATSNVNGRVDEIRMVNIWSKEPCLLSRIKAGTITVHLSEFGNGDGLALKDWQVSNTVQYQQLTADSNIELLLSPPS